MPTSNDFQLPNVSSQHGAPMGRPCWPRTDAGKLDVSSTTCFVKKARCWRLPFVDGAYDRGGAYWGSPNNLYAVTNGFLGDEDTFQLFIRAGSRQEAKQKALTLCPRITFFR